MYERISDTARKAMQFANQAAQHYHHKYIGTEHILLGIIDEGSGAAITVLKSLDVDLQRIPARIEEIVQLGPDMVTMGRLPQTPRAKKIIEYAMEEARGLNHNSIGTEHLLLGLIREKEGVAGEVLRDFGVRLDEARNEVMKLSEREPPPAQGSVTEYWETPQFGARGLRRFVAQLGRALGLGRSSPTPSVIVPLDPKHLEEEIERLTRAKEEAVAKLDFKLAARLRDQADELKRKRFTDQARKAMQMANQEALRFEHEYVGTEHLLLGIIAEGSGNAIVVFKTWNIDPQKIRLEIEKILMRGPHPVTAARLPLTPPAKKVVEYAMSETRDLQHDSVGTEHLLLGMLRVEDGVAGQVLMNLGLSLDEVRNEIAKQTAREPVTG